jgi:hypothetical protein
MNLAGDGVIVRSGGQGGAAGGCRGIGDAGPDGGRSIVS